ncbi:uncharacterized [Tachysurus ichikawai]
MRTFNQTKRIRICGAARYPPVSPELFLARVSHISFPHKHALSQSGMHLDEFIGLFVPVHRDAAQALRMALISVGLL